MDQIVPYGVFSSRRDDIIPSRDNFYFALFFILHFLNEVSATSMVHCHILSMLEGHHSKINGGV